MSVRSVRRCRSPYASSAQATLHDPRTILGEAGSPRPNSYPVVFRTNANQMTMAAASPQGGVLPRPLQYRVLALGVSRFFRSLQLEVLLRLLRRCIDRKGSAGA